MNVLATLSLEIAALVATVLVAQFTVLAFRNPHRPGWLRSDTLQTLVAVGLVAAGCLSTGALIAGLVGAGVNVFATLGAAIVVPVAAAVASSRLVGFRERLRRADAGESPFYAFVWNRLGKSTAPHG